MTKHDVPLPEVSEAIKRLDVNGKIHEIHDMDWAKLKGLEKPCDEQNTGIRALAATLANDEAGRLGADWVLWLASDQVFYNSAKELHALAENRSGCDGFQFYEHKAFWGSQWHMCRDATDPYSNSDGAKFYKFGGNGGQRQWFAGEGGIMNYRQQRPDDSILTAHMRECWPVQGREELDLVSLLWYQVQRYYTLHLDHNKVEGIEQNHQDVFRFAVNSAWGIVQRAAWSNLRPADPIPQIFNIEPLAYIESGQPK